MEAKVYRASLLNSYAAADIATDTSVNPNQIRIPGLLPMAVGTIRSVVAETAVTEISGIWTLGVAVTPTIVSSTRYQIYFGDNGNTQQALAVSWKPRGYTSPAVLSGVATYGPGIDRHNAYVAITTQINTDPVAYATAYPLITVAQTNSVAFAVGEVVTETASGATGINISGTTGTLTIAVVSGTWSGIATGTSTSGTLTGSIAGASTSTTHITTAGIGLRIVDDAGYYTPNTQRVGPNSCMATIGFSSSMLVNTTAGVVSRGQGNFLLLDVPVMELLTDNLRSGTWEMATNNAPIAGHAYTKVNILYTPYAFANGPGVGAQIMEAEQVLYLDEADGDLAATLSALDALNP